MPVCWERECFTGFWISSFEEESLDHQVTSAQLESGSVPLKRSAGRGSASRQSRSVLLKKRESGKRSLKKRESGSVLLKKKESGSVLLKKRVCEKDF